MADVAETVAEIVYWHRRRRFAMSQRIRVGLALQSFLRMQVGLACPELTPARVKARASALFKAGSLAAAGKDAACADPAWPEWRDVIAASMLARQPFVDEEKACDKALQKLARSLPVWPAFCADVRGFGPGSLAAIVGEAGDIGNYRNEACLWKRMGLAVIDGRRQGNPGTNASAATWIRHGYNAERRAVMAQVVDNGFVMKGGRYGDLVRQRKAVEVERCEAAGLTVAPASDIPKGAEGYVSRGYIDNRAKRWVAKRFLRDLYRTWRSTAAADDGAPHPGPLPAGEGECCGV